MKIKNALIICDDNLSRLKELYTVSQQFTENIDALIFTDKDQIPGKFNNAFSINDIPANATDTIVEISKQYSLVLSSGFIGTSLAGIIAYKNRGSFVPGITSIDYNNTIFSHSVYGNKAMIRYKVTRLPIIITVSEKYFQPAQLNGLTKLEKIQIQKKNVIVTEEKIEETLVDLDKANVVIAGGRGIGSKDGFEILQQIADLTSGVVGASRAAVDNGWIHHNYQIGQSGVSIASKLYFAFGISGASQHLAGIKNVKYVIAINKDEDAPIFKRARYGIVSDWKTFALELINKLKESKGLSNA